MRIAIIGPGALGCLFAASISRSAGQADDLPWLLDHSPERAATLEDQGLIYENDTAPQPLPIRSAADSKNVPDFDIILVCVKSYSLAFALKQWQPLISANNLLVFLQNGIGHLGVEKDFALPHSPAFASSSEGATLLGPGRIRHAGHGITRLGFPSPPREQQKQLLEEFIQVLQGSGLNSSPSSDIRARLWEKLFINVAINPLTAIYNRSNGQILTSCAARSRIKKVVGEAEAVARALGITITSDPLQATLAVCKKTSRNISSMLQDVRNRRPTEIEAITGALIREARKVAVPTPYNDELYSQIKKIEAGYPAGPLGRT
jgi:2-dehydropantoate 2-reductase